MTIGLSLNTLYTEKCNLLCKLDFILGIDHDLKALNDGKKIRFEYDGSTSFVFKNIRYNLNEIVLYVPSYHKLDNIHYDGELMFICRNKEMKRSLVLSSLLEVNDEINTNTDVFFKELSSNLPRRRSKEKISLDLPKEFQLLHLFPEVRSFYNYKISKNMDGEEYQYVIFSNIISIYYEYYASIKQKISNTRRKYAQNSDIVVYYNKNEQKKRSMSDVKEPDAKLHFVKCRKVRKTIKDDQNNQDETVYTEFDVPKDIVSFFRTVVTIISLLSMFFLVILTVKLINRSCGVERFTEFLEDLWGKTVQLGARGMDAIKKKRGKK